MGKHRISSSKLAVAISLSFLLVAAATVSARPTTPQEARLVVAGWLADNAEPFGIQIGTEVTAIETITGDAREPLYHVVCLSPAGIVIVAADDLVEPILSFTDGQDYEPSPQDPLTALIRGDINRRLSEVYSGTSNHITVQSAADARSKWHELINRATSPESTIRALSRQTISDIRVAPLLTTRWAQGSVCSRPCYNYYAPNNYLAGCVAISMAQLMFYYRYPVNGIGRRSFDVEVLGEDRTLSTRGGDGLGGRYLWDDMIPSPGCSTTTEQREAIGALCYDAGLAVRTEYGPEASTADAFIIAKALREVFGFGNGVNGANKGQEIGSGLADMINPNLDAEYPVILGIVGNSGHAVVADGYGYDLSATKRTLYHHINMGWSGYQDVWYNLPDAGNYDTVPACVYNLFIEGRGEIVSGRVADGLNQPITAALVTATHGGGRHTATTNARGIYALISLPSAGTFTIRVSKPGLVFAERTVTTGTSRDWKALAGNRWGIDFVGRTADLAVLAGNWLGGSVPSDPQ